MEKKLESHIETGVIKANKDVRNQATIGQKPRHLLYALNPKPYTRLAQAPALNPEP